jgi:hypothetical protein
VGVTPSQKNVGAASAFPVSLPAPYASHLRLFTRLQICYHHAFNAPPIVFVYRLLVLVHHTLVLSVYFVISVLVWLFWVSFG